MRNSSGNFLFLFCLAQADRNHVCRAQPPQHEKQPLMDRALTARLSQRVLGAFVDCGIREVQFITASATQAEERASSQNTLPAVGSSDSVGPSSPGPKAAAGRNEDSPRSYVPDAAVTHARLSASPLSSGPIQASRQPLPARPVRSVSPLRPSRLGEPPQP